MYTVFAIKDRRTTYVHHGTRNEVGGSFSTADAGWSLKMAILYEIARLPKGVEYQIERNGIILDSNPY